MDKELDKLLEVPEDALRDIYEFEREIRRAQRRYKKKPYPSNNDIVEAIREVLRQNYYVHPDDFPSHVIEFLEMQGYDARHVTVKRVWRLYEMLVRRGIIRDYLGVVTR